LPIVAWRCLALPGVASDRRLVDVDKNSVGDANGIVVPATFNSRKGTNMNLSFALADMPSPRDSSAFFYLSDQWIKLRYRVLSQRGNNCECCGRSWSIGNPLQVDHIKPKSLFPHLALEPSNLQILCRECNVGKSNIDTTDWRRPQQPQAA